MDNLPVLRNCLYPRIVRRKISQKMDVVQDADQRGRLFTIQRHFLHSDLNDAFLELCVEPPKARGEIFARTIEACGAGLGVKIVYLRIWNRPREEIVPDISMVVGRKPHAKTLLEHVLQG